MKGLTKDLIGKYIILNGAKYFSSDGMQHYLVFILTRCINWISEDSSDSKIEWWGLQECHKKVLKTRILQTLVYLQS